MALVFAVAGLVACSSVEPRSDISVRVWNGDCVYGGRCGPLHILAFPDSGPTTPAGNWNVDLGVVAGPTACLTIPPSSTFTIIGGNGTGGVDTLVWVWTPAKPVSLGVWPEGSSRFQAAPDTPVFVAATSRGWDLTVWGGVRVSAGDPCGP
jgi:hypothetical protein